MTRKNIEDLIYSVVDERGLPKQYAIAMIANAGAESAYDPKIRQRGSNQDISLDEYLNSPDSGRGYGLFQFDGLTRQGYAKYLKLYNLQDSAESQINFALDDISANLGKEINDGSVMGHGNAEKFRKKMETASPEEAVRFFAIDYERAGTLDDFGEMERRLAFMPVSDEVVQREEATKIPEIRMTDPTDSIIQAIPEPNRFRVDRYGFMTINPRGQRQ